MYINIRSTLPTLVALSLVVLPGQAGFAQDTAESEQRSSQSGYENDPEFGNEVVLETSYMYQLSKNFSLTPDLQFIFNPAHNPGESSVWIISLRAILRL